MPALRWKSAPASWRVRTNGGDGGMADRHEPDISAERPDWSREAKRFWQWAPSRSLLASIRSYQHCKARGGVLGAIGARIAVLRHRFWSVVTGADIPVNCQIGGGLLLPHPNGIVIHSDVRIGPNCLLFQQVTLGMVQGGVPELGGHVDVGAGARILGQVRIGDHARIGANALVLKDVPADGVALAPLAEIRHSGSPAGDSLPLKDEV